MSAARTFAVQIMQPQCTQIESFSKSIIFWSVITTVIVLISFILMIVAWVNLTPKKKDDGTSAETDDEKKAREKRVRDMIIAVTVMSGAAALGTTFTANNGRRLAACMATGTPVG